MNYPSDDEIHLTGVRQVGTPENQRVRIINILDNPSSYARTATAAQSQNGGDQLMGSGTIGAGNHSLPHVNSFSSHSQGSFGRTSSASDLGAQDFVELPRRVALAPDEMDQIIYACIEELRKLEGIIKTPPMDFSCYNYEMIHQLATKLPHNAGALYQILQALIRTPHTLNNFMQQHSPRILEITSKYRHYKDHLMLHNKENSRSLAVGAQGRRFGTQLFPSPQPTWSQHQQPTFSSSRGPGTGTVGVGSSHGHLASAASGLQRSMRDLKRTATSVQAELAQLNQSMGEHQSLQSKRTKVSVTMNIHLNSGQSSQEYSFNPNLLVGDEDFDMELENTDDSSDSEYTPPGTQSQSHDLRPKAYGIRRRAD